MRRLAVVYRGNEVHTRFVEGGQSAPEGFVFESRADVLPVSLSGQSEITIGRSSQCDICLAGTQVSGRHALLRKTAAGWAIEDQQSRNGIYINGKKAQKSVLRDGDTIFLGGYLICLRNSALHFDSAPAGVTTKLKAPAIKQERFIVPEYPVFQRSPRLKPQLSTTQVELLSPPQAGTKPSISWAMVLLPPILMIAVMVAVALITQRMETLFFTMPMSVLSIVAAVLSYRSQTKKWRESQGKAEETYAIHLHEKEAEIKAAEQSYIKALETAHPNFATCQRIVKQRERRLWERSPGEDDFLALRVGTGDMPSNVSLKLPQAQLSIEENPLLAQATHLRARHEILKNIPVALPLKEARIVGLAGKSGAMRQVLCSMIAAVAAHHSYEDVKICCVYPESEQQYWNWLRWLPHCWNAGRTERFLACNPEDSKKLLQQINEIHKLRQRGQANAAPHYVIILIDDCGTALLPDEGMGMSVIYAYGDLARLPGECRTIVTCDKSGAVQDKIHGGNISFSPEQITEKEMDQLARALAPVRLRMSVGASQMSEYVTFMQGYGVSKAEELDLLGRWAKSRPFESLAVPIALRENGEPFRFDIHERGHGPHGIVAGATRWGKSETLTTWLLSLALHFSPQELSFVLIDFKGDGLAGILMDLPHVAGTISNINDFGAIERNLQSLKAELLRRQKVFAQTKLENIHKYQQAVRTGRAEEPMPYLIIVIDEFAELKDQHSEQMDKFISIARTGGSLGVYMVLATQSPGGGVVSGQVAANSRFRICLKTAEAAESKDILGTTDAFGITVRGRAIVKVGNNEVYEHIQPFYSKASYRPGVRPANEKIELVTLKGERIRPEIYDKTIGADFDDSEGRAVATYIKQTAMRAGIANARPVWAPALLKKLHLPALKQPQEGFAVSVGLVDDLDNQRQNEFILDFAGEGHQMIFGAPGSGKTELLRTALLAAAQKHTPEQAQFALLDYGTWGLKLFEALPHTRVAAYGGDEAALRQAGEVLLYELERRKQCFAAQGVGRLEDYRELSDEAMPWLLIAIDNLTTLHSQSPDFMETLLTVAREGAALGLVLLITLGGQGSFLFQLTQYVTNIHCLRMADKGDYRQYVGGNGQREPAHLPGRGFVRGPLEFQTALCVEGAREAERIKHLRDAVMALSLPSQNEEPVMEDGAGLLLGTAALSGKPWYFDAQEMSGCVIYDGAALLRYIAERLDMQVTRWEGDATVFDEVIKQLAEDYDRRCENNQSEPHVAICIDDLVACYDAIADETADLLDLLIRYGESYGIYIYIAGDTAGLTRYNQLGVPALQSALLSGNVITVTGREALVEHGGAKLKIRLREDIANA